MERLKGAINSQEIGEKMSSVIWKELEKQGKVDLEVPDKTILIVSLGKLFFIGFVSGEMKEKYYLLDFE